MHLVGKTRSFFVNVEAGGVAYLHSVQCCSLKADRIHDIVPEVCDRIQHTTAQCTTSHAKPSSKPTY